MASTSLSELPFPVLRVLGDFVMKPGTGLAEREISDYELLCFPEGTGTVYRVGEQSYTLRRPCFVVTRPGERHSYKYDEQAHSRHLFVHFLLGDMPPASVPLLLPEGPSVIEYEDDFPVSLLKRLLTIAHADPERLQARGGSLLLALLTELHSLSAAGGTRARSAARRPPQIEQALREIERTVPAPIAVEDLAARVGWTPEHLSRSFVRHLGFTPKEAITRRRIDLACQLLLHGQQSVKEIAFEVGFADPNYFSRVFKATKAVSASDYRRKNHHPRYADLALGLGGEAPYPTNRVFFGER